MNSEGNRSETEKVPKSWISIVLAVALGSIAVGCNADAGRELPPVELDRNRADLTAQQARVLGFEQAASDWSWPGGTVGESTNATQGSGALSVQPNGWTEITSVDLDSLGQVAGSLSFDVRVPSAPPWGEVRAIVIIDSLELWQDIGGTALSSLPVGEYQTVQFTLPGNVIAALEDDYTDLKLRIVFNAPGGLGQFLVDNMQLADENAQPGDPHDETFSIVIPEGEQLDSIVLTTSEFLKIDSRVEVGVSGSLTAIGSAGTPGIQFHSAALGHTDMYSKGLVWLGSQAVVDGIIRSEVPVERQDGSVDFPPEREQVVPSVGFSTFTWTVEFPDVATPLDAVNAPDVVTLAPGAYSGLSINGGIVNLRSGTYFFDSIFVSENGSEIHVDQSSGDPLVIYTRGNLTLRGPLVVDEGPEGQILIGHLGSNLAYVQAPFVGTIVSPNGGIDLHRPDGNQHKGGFFGKTIEVHSDLQVIPIPFDFDSLGDPLDEPDTDEDGVDDPDDICLLDASKTEPGICGCNIPDDLDSDTDGVPDCIDPCPEDPNNTTIGPCGCLNEWHLRPAGAPCFSIDGSSAGQCDGSGQCDAPDSPPLDEGDGNGTCFKIPARGHIYWFCSGNHTWDEAETACNALPRRHLLKADDRIENDWLTTHIDGAMWLGGSDLDSEGNWYWASDVTRQAKLFWQGDASGTNVNRRYYNWAAGAPGSGDCLTMQPDGTWIDRDCSTTTGFICEQPIIPRRPTPPPPGLPGYPSIPDDADTSDPTSGCFEAEDGISAGSPQVISDVDASNGSAVLFTNTSYTTPGPQRLSFDFTAAAGTYRVWLRLLAPTPDDDSLWFSLDGAPFILANNYSTLNDWTWVLLHDSNAGEQVVELPLAAGTHSIEIANREDGTLLDKVLVTSSLVTPTGTECPADTGDFSCMENVGFGDPVSDPNPDSAEMQAKYNGAVSDRNACLAACPEGTDPADCDETECGGLNAVPSTLGLCQAYTPIEKGLCEIDFFTTTECEDNTDCASGDLCARRSVCAELERPQACGGPGDAACGTGFTCFDRRCVIDCSASACPSGLTCESERSICVDESKANPCDDRLGDPVTGECVGLCYSTNRCGTPDPDCAVDVPFQDACQQIDACHPQTIDETPMLNDDVNFEGVFNPADVFVPPEEIVDPYPLSKPEDCGDPDDPCDYEIGEHPWCTLDLADTLSADELELDNDVSDMDDLGNTQGGGGRGGPISFDFDPDLTMDYHVSALPFGDARFNVQARAGATAGVDFSLFGFYEGRVSILEAYGDLAAERCGLRADARLALVGVDFLPVLMGDNYSLLDDFDTSEPAMTACEEQVAEFERLINRAKKALRDAQELIRQHRLLITEGKRFPDDLCDQLLTGAHLPDDFFLGTPNGSCEGLTPQQTINLFVNHYRREVVRLIQQQATMLTVGLADLVPRDMNQQMQVPDLPPDYPGNVPLDLSVPKWEFQIPLMEQDEDDGRQESQQVANVPFAIGPVPMNLTVDVFYGYGVMGHLGFRFLPTNLLVAYRDSGVAHPLAEVEAVVTPYAGAGVTLFVGAGFDFGALSAKIGIAGSVALGQVEVPISAGAGVRVATENDERALPPDLAVMASGNTPLFPPGPPVPQKFLFDAGYKLGASLDVTGILHGDIDARLKISFAFFSKTWKVKILRFRSGIPDIHETIIDVNEGLGLEFDLGPLGGFQMPLPFVDLQPLPQSLPPLDPLPPPEDLPPPGEGPSLLVIDDPRIASFDSSRVQELFYDGFCEPLQCVPQTFFSMPIEAPQNDPADVVGNECMDSEECCQDDPQGRPVSCEPLIFNEPGPAYCQACRGHNEIPFVHLSEEQAFCCEGLSFYSLPGGFICSESCRREGDLCVTDATLPCCDGTTCQDVGSAQFRCVPQTCGDVDDDCGNAGDLPCCPGLVCGAGSTCVEPIIGDPR